MAVVRKIECLCASAAAEVANLAARLSPKALRSDPRSAGLLVAAVFCAVMPMELSHLVSVVVGAAGYLLLQMLQPSVQRPPPKKVAKSVPCTPRSPAWRRGGERTPASSWPSHGDAAPRAAARTAVVPKPHVRKPSVMPVVAPTFRSSGWDEEVKELVGQLMPTPKVDVVVAQIARTVKQSISPIIPGADVTGFACGNLMNGMAFGVAVPEVDIVINASAKVLVGCLQGRWSQGRGITKLDARKLQKSAIRACADRLVGSGGFKFRRSAFRGLEPKVTLIATTGSECSQGVPINLSVNASTPLHTAVLLSDCDRIEPRTRELILFVRRWAKDRGLSHVAKGHLSPYAWTLLTMYFLQVRGEEEGPLLPPLSHFEASSGLQGKGSAPAERPRWAPPRHVEGAERPVGALFKDLVRFYTAEFDWRNEAVSVRLGRRASPDLALPLHIIVHEDGETTEVGPSIEDPFSVANNLGACVTAASFKHLREELQRAATMCARGASLTEFLEPWAPADLQQEGAEEQDDGAEG